MDSSPGINEKAPGIIHGKVQFIFILTELPKMVTITTMFTEIIIDVWYLLK